MRTVSKAVLVLFTLLSLLGLSILSCAQPSPTTTPKPTPTPTATPTPTSTATPSPKPTATPTPTPTATPTPAPTGTLPKIIGWATYASGSSGYVLFAGMGQAITKATGMQVRVIPSGSNKSFILPMLRGETQLTGIVFGTGLYAALNGTHEWWEEGPQPISIVWNGEPEYNAVAVRADSNIYSWKDIKGRRYPDFSKLDPSSQVKSDALLAFGGLKKADTIPVDVINYTTAMGYVIEGNLDVAWGSPKAAISYQLVSTIHGGRFFEMPPTDTEGWKRVQEVSPSMVPWKCTVGATASKESPKWWAGGPYPISCMANADEYMIYRITKAFIEGYDIYKDVNPAAPLWTLDMCLDPALFKANLTRFHPGAVRAFKEAGRWTPEMDKLQQQAIKFDEMRLDLWNKAKEEGLAKNILVGTEPWKTFWLAKWDAFIREAAWRK